MKGQTGGKKMDNGASSYRRFLDGDESAFDGIMQELFHNLVFFINRYVQDLHAAEDLAIDTLTDLLVHRNRYNFKVTLKTYLFMIGRSRALDYIKRRKTVEFVSLTAAELLPDTGMTLEETLLSDRRKQAVNNAIAQLSQEMQAVVHLIYFEDLSYEEAAKILKKNKKQVDNLLYRAKKELRILLGEDGEQLL